MHKKRLHFMAHKLDWLKPVHLVVLTVVSGSVCIYALRANNEHMAQLRSALYQADQKNDNVQGALQALQHYVTAHMNTDLSTGNTAVYPPIQLVGTYNRLVEAQGAALQQQNSQLYTEAQHYCEQLDPVDFSGHNRVPCIEQYVTSHGVQAPAAVPPSLYQFDFVSPWWSPDLAGWSLLVTILSALSALGLFVYRKLRRT